MPTLHLIIRGKVQGVFYRASAKKMATAFSIKGWIRNTDNGNVESLVSGTHEQLKNYVNWCRQGPAEANVIDVIVSENEEIEFESFVIRH